MFMFDVSGSIRKRQHPKNVLSLSLTNNSLREEHAKHIKISAFDCPDAYFKVLTAIWREGDIFKVGFGSEETETKKLNLSIEVTNPENRPLTSDKAPCDFKYVQGYALEYLWCGECAGRPKPTRTAAD
jgi:hypothetical protein